MARNQESSPEVDNLLLSSIAQSSPILQDKLARLLDIQIAEAEEKRGVKLAARELELAAKKQGADVAIRKLEMRKVIQTRCRHRHYLDGTPLVTAIRLPGGRMSITCGNEECQKEWEGSPAELKSNPELLGLYPMDEQIGGIIG